MNGRVLLVRVVLAISVWFFGAAFAADVGEGDFYVSPEGSDADSGTVDGPFGSIGRAQRAVREKIKDGLDGPVTVVLRGGRYELDSPLVFGREDSGTGEYCVSYRAYPGESPRVCGGRIIEGWKKGGAGLWLTDVGEVKGGDWHFRQLYADGERLLRGRFPKEGLLRIKKVSSDVKTIEFDKGLPGGLGGRDVEVVVVQNWSIARAVVVSCEGRAATCATPLGWVGHGWTTASAGKPAYLENSLAFLNGPGQWHLDRSSGVLSYAAGPNESVKGKRFVAPKVNQLLVIEGEVESPVRNVRFSGITFEHSAWALPEGGYGGIQAGYNGTKNVPNEELERALPAAVELSYAEDCVFEYCRFVHIGSSGIGLGAGTRRNRIVGCEVSDIGGNGIHIGLPAGPISTLAQDWGDERDVPSGNEVSNCWVHHCAAENFGCVGIFAAFSGDTRIGHNEVSDMPYTGVSIGFRWNPSPSSQANCVVEYNHIHEILTKLADGGGIYTLGFQPGTILRGNHIHDIHRSSYAHGGAPNNGIFFDEGSKGFLVEDNIIYNTSGQAIRFNQNKKEWHTWRDNSFGVAWSEAGFRKSEAEFAGVEGRYESRFPGLRQTE